MQKARKDAAKLVQTIRTTDNIGLMGVKAKEIIARGVYDEYAISFFAEIGCRLAGGTIDEKRFAKRL
jgi:hypothetical protein